MPLRRPAPPTIMAAVFAASGVAHLVVPRIYEAIVPRWLPARRALVLGSGALELAAAAGLAAGESWAGPLGAAVLVAVWPANVQMALDARRDRRSPALQVALWLRVPLQVPMLRAVLAGRSGRARGR